MSRASNILQELSKDSLLTLVPGLPELTLEKGSIRLVQAGTELAIEGSAIEELLIPLDSAVKLHYGNGKVTYLQRRQSLCLREILDGQNYPYTARVEVSTRVISIPRNEFESLLHHHPAVRNYLSLMTNSSAIRNFKRFLGDQGLRQESILQLISRIHTQKEPLSEKQPLAQDRVWFLRSGRIRIRGDGLSRSQFSIELSEGAWFGGEALVPSNRLSYRAEVISKCELHWIAIADLRPFLEASGLIETVYDEPWISRIRAWESIPPAQTTDTGSLPGKLLNFEEALNAGLGKNAEKLVAARSSSESYIASLSNLCTLLGAPKPPLANGFTMFADGKASLLRIAQILEPNGVHTRPRKTDVSQLHRHSTPLLLFAAGRLLILVEAPEADQAFYLHDPIQGWISMTPEELKSVWDGQILEVTLAQDLAPRKELFEQFLGRLAPYRGELLNLFGLSVIGSGLSACIPWLSQNLLDQVVQLKNPSGMVWPIAAMIVTALIGMAVRIARSLVQTDFGLRFEEEISSIFYRHCLNLPYEQFLGEKTGGVMTRIHATTLIQQFLTGSPLESILSLLGTVICIAILATYSLPFATFLFVVIAGMIWAHTRAQRPLLEKLYQALVVDGESQSLVGEQIGAIAAIKASASEQSMRTRWERAYLERIKVVRDMSFYGVSKMGMAWAAGKLAWIGSALTGAWLAHAGKISVGEALAMTLLTTLALEPVFRFWIEVFACAQFQVAVGALEETLNTPLEQTPERSASRHSLNLSGKIRLEKVSFRYSESSPWALREVSLTIYPKQLIAVVGASGSGKTTLAHILSGALKPTMGRVFFDDFDSNFLSLGSLRSQTGFVMQGNELFQGSVLENVAYADDAPEIERVDRALQMSQASSFVMKNKNGLQRTLGEGGSGLSGGERQRLSIARTLYRDPTVLILDEATSALDAASEKAVLEALESTLLDRTVVLIAQRLSAIRRADRIIVVQDGEITEEGTLAQLVENRGPFFSMFHKQLEMESQ